MPRFGKAKAAFTEQDRLEKQRYELADKWTLPKVSFSDFQNKPVTVEVLQVGDAFLFKSDKDKGIFGVSIRARNILAGFATSNTTHRAIVKFMGREWKDFVADRKEYERLAAELRRFEDLEYAQRIVTKYGIALIPKLASSTPKRKGSRSKAVGSH